MKIFNGKKLAEKILTDLKNKIKKEKIKPRLAVIFVGNNRDSQLYIKNKKRAAQKIGLKIQVFHFKKLLKEKKLVALIKKLNQDKSINGIIVQLPLPKNLKSERIVKLILSYKDVDGFQKNSCFTPPLISAISLALKKATHAYDRKKMVALVNSDFFGQAVKNFFKKQGIKVNYLKRPFNQQKLKLVKLADILISVCGCPDLIKGDMIKKGAILIDAGITVLPTKEVKGDVDAKSVIKKASFLTPVPGGIGPLTVAFLLKNVYEAKKISNN